MSKILNSHMKLHKDKKRTTLFPDLNLAGGRNSGTGSEPKADTSSPDKLMVLPNKESICFFILKEGGGTPPAPPVLIIIFLIFTIQGGSVPT